MCDSELLQGEAENHTVQRVTTRILRNQEETQRDEENLPDLPFISESIELKPDQGEYYMR